MSITSAGLLELNRNQRELFSIRASHLNPDQTLFLAENEAVIIQPNFSADAFDCIAGKFGPFMPDFDAQVPIWLALMLKRQKKCRVLAPHWMEVESLESILEEQKKTRELVPLPFYYVELFTLFSLHFSKDVDHWDRIKTLCADIQQYRKVLIINFLRNNPSNIMAWSWDNISQFELSMVRHHIKSVQRIVYEWTEKKHKIVSGRRDPGSGSHSFSNTEETEPSQQDEGGVRDLRDFRRR